MQERALAPLQTAVQEMSKELKQNKQQVQKLEAEAQQAQQHAQQVQQTYAQQQAANNQAQNNTQAHSPQTGAGANSTNTPSQPQGAGGATGSNAGAGKTTPGTNQNTPRTGQNAPQQGNTQTGATNTKPSAPKQPQANAHGNTMHQTQSLSAGITPPSVSANGANAMHANNKRDTMALAAHTQTNYAKDADATSKNANAAMPKTGDSAAVTLALTLFAAGVTTLGARKLYSRKACNASKRQ